MYLVFATVSLPAMEALQTIRKDFKKDYPDVVLEFFDTSRQLEAPEREALERAARTGDFVFVDMMGSHPAVTEAVERGLARNDHGQRVPFGGFLRDYLRLGKFSADGMRNKGHKKPSPDAMKKMAKAAEMMGKVIPGKMRDMRNYSLICNYFQAANKQNILQMLYLILREYGGIDCPVPEPPEEFPALALRNPAESKVYTDIKAWNQDYPPRPGKPAVVILYYGTRYPTDAAPLANAVCEVLRPEADIYPIAVAGVTQDTQKELGALLRVNLPKKPQLILNLMSFRLGAGPMGGPAEAAVDMLRELDVPYLHPVTMSRRTEAEWRDSTQGCAPSEVLISILLPELDGALETFPIGALSVEPHPELEGVLSRRIEPIEERLQRLKDKVHRYLALRNKPNQDKKIAVVCYNYPPGEANVFGGAFLDTFRSVAAILRTLKDNGYQTESLTSAELIARFGAGGEANSPLYGDLTGRGFRYPAKAYREAFEQDPQADKVQAVWGNPPGDIMTDREGFYIPGIQAGNVFVGLQPARDYTVDATSYHDQSLPPHHQYRAFYRWLRDVFQADAIVHVGTHGTLEFQAGKEAGMSGACFPDSLLGDIPHLYFYYCGNPAEATIAKRRSHAQLISYQPPVFVPGDLYGEYRKLQEAIDDHARALALEPQRAPAAEQTALAMARELNLPGDLDAIESELYRMQRSLIPRGLHVLGESYTQEEVDDYALGLLGHSLNGEKSARRLMIERLGLDPETEKSADLHTLRALDQQLADLLHFYREDPKGYQAEPYLQKALSEAVKQAEKSRDNRELESLIAALSGHYLPARLGGDIYRSPEVLPTGGNLYQFDPRRVPTDVARARGREIADQALAIYLAEEQRYPESTAVILWGLETSRTQGETVGQILAYLGVRVLDSGMGWNPRFEIIPLAELGRPRIDVTVTICGFFRDMFPNLLENFTDIFKRLYELDESDEENYFKKHTKMIRDRLVAEGMDPDTALEYALVRIFGPREGEYGTSLTGQIETRAWDKADELGNLFLDQLSYAYTRDRHGIKIDGLYRNNLQTVEVVSQLRSSHEYEITDLDHYYEFFGGLSKSVEVVRGRQAKMLIADVTGEQVQTESVDRSIARGVRTRLTNPKWIEGLLEHDRHATQEVAKRFENIVGLQATTGQVAQWIYNDLYETYVANDRYRKAFEQNNPLSYMELLSRLLESVEREHWQADEAKIAKLKEHYLRLEHGVERSL